jgi:hypothetical protein
MLAAIVARSSAYGEVGQCLFCHGGTSPAPTPETAHVGAPDDLPPQTYLPAPASIWVADQVCGECHQNTIDTLTRALMQTEAGKIQGTTWGFGAFEGTEHRWANYNVDALQEFPVGSDAYHAYIARLIEAIPNVFPSRMEQVPAPDMERLAQDPRQAAFTYIRTECQRCHVGVRGARRRGDWRGVGCAACHIPYSNEGFYQGEDPSIPRDEPGHVLVHRIQSSREAQVQVGDVTYSGIPVETCTTCHNRGKRIGVSFQGLMETAWRGAPNEAGGLQPGLHGKYYLFVEDDRHHRGSGDEGGLLCQDCHTSIDVHGDGHLFGTNLAQVEIECTDCHGTPGQYPWELPLGFGDELGLELGSDARGTVSTPTDQMRMGTLYPSEEGYLLSARGNPLGNVVRRGNRVILHSASGTDHEVPALRVRRDQFTDEGRVAMEGIERHIEQLECSACHTTWAPQCYGCHVTVDYSGDHRGTDWIAAGNLRNAAGLTADMIDGLTPPTLPGQVREERSYLRWEEPALAVNGEGRVTPVVPGCQTTTTIIGPDGEALAHSAIWRGPPDVEGGGAEGQRTLDMSPTTPHTVTRNARTCVSCHANAMALGYGVGGGAYQRRNSEPITVDLATFDHQTIPARSKVQLQPVPELPFDWSRFVTEDGQQLQTVGHHLPLSAPLSQETRERMQRVGACLACHRDIPAGTPFVQALTAGSELVMPVHSDEDHAWVLNHLLNTAAAAQILLPILAMISLVAFIVVWVRRGRRRRRDEAKKSE